MSFNQALRYTKLHLKTLEYATSCAEMGAHVRTISLLTGLPMSKLRNFLPQPTQAHRGRRPDTPELYHSTNLLFRVEASLFVSLFQLLLSSGLSPPNAFLGAYRHYCARCPHTPRISFERAFDLASHVATLWIAKTARFSLVACPCCQCQYLSEAITIMPNNNSECPFCKLTARYCHYKDTRIKASYPTRPLPE